MSWRECYCSIVSCCWKVMSFVVSLAMTVVLKCASHGNFLSLFSTMSPRDVFPNPWSSPILDPPVIVVVSALSCCLVLVRCCNSRRDLQSDLQSDLQEMRARERQASLQPPSGEVAVVYHIQAKLHFLFKRSSFKTITFFYCKFSFLFPFLFLTLLCVFFLIHFLHTVSPTH